MAIVDLTRARRTGLTVFLPAFAFIALLSCLWALASPIFSTPDENAHAMKAIAQVRGEIIGHRVPGVRQLVVDLPDSYRYDPGIVCFVRNPQVSANCGATLGGTNGVNSFATWVSSYNPVFYYLIGWPSLFVGGVTGIYLMRIVGALLAAVFFAFAFQAGMAARRARWLPVGLGFLASPMIVYLAGSVSPQGIEIASAAALWVALLRLLESHHDSNSVLPRWYLWVMVTAAASFLVLARSLGVLWLVIVISAALAIAGWQATKALFARRASYVGIAVIAVAGIFSLLWTLGGGSLSGQAEKGDAPLVGGTFISGGWSMLRSTTVYVEQAAGVFGWLDTRLPSYAYAFYYGAILIVIVLAAVSTVRRGAWIIIGMLALAVLVPVAVQAYSVHQTGIIWQGRYALFLYVGVILVAAWLLSTAASSERISFISVRITAVVVGLLAAYQIVAFVYVLRRYVVGINQPVLKMLSHPGWQPPLGWETLVALLIIVIVGFSVWVLRLAVLAARDSQHALVGHG